MSPALSILGASARSAAASAVRAGFQPCAVDLFADSDTQALVPTTRIAEYPHDFLKIASQLPASPWLYTGGLENYPDLIAAIAALRPLWGNAGEVLSAVRDPLAWAHVLRDAGVATPMVTLEARGLPLDGTWLAKPRRSSGGFGIRVIDESFAPSHGDLFFQERIRGAPASAVFVGAARTATLLGATSQLSGASWTGASAFVYAGSIGPLQIDDRTAKLMNRIGQALVGAFDLTGLFGVDGILSERGFVPIEINPRYIASIEVLERATGQHFLQFHADACRHATLPTFAWATEKNLHGKAILYALRDVTFTTAAAECIEHMNAGVCWPVVADIPFVGEPIPQGSPIVTVFSAGESHHEVVTRLQASCAMVRAAIES